MVGRAATLDQGRELLQEPLCLLRLAPGSKLRQGPAPGGV